MLRTSRATRRSQMRRRARCPPTLIARCDLAPVLSYLESLCFFLAFLLLSAFLFDAMAPATLQLGVWFWIQRGLSSVLTVDAWHPSTHMGTGGYSGDVEGVQEDYEWADHEEMGGALEKCESMVADLTTRRSGARAPP